MNKVQLFIVKTMEKDFLEKAEFIGYSEEEAVGLQFKRIMMSFCLSVNCYFFLNSKTLDRFNCICCSWFFCL